MERLFYFTACNNIAQEHLNDTIINSYPLSNISNLLTKEELDIVNNASSIDGVKMWGAVPGPSNKSNWSKINVGDKALVYTTDYFTYYGEVAGKFRNREVANFVWGNDQNGKTWEYIYLLRNIQKVRIHKADFCKLFGYLQNFTPQGFSFIRDELIDYIIGVFGSLDNAVLKFLNKTTMQKDLNNIDKKLEKKLSSRTMENYLLEIEDDEFDKQWESLGINASIEERKGIVRYRKYNKKLIDELKKKNKYQCQICGEGTLNKYGVSVVEAHHIERFSLTQNNSPSNIIILCPNHHRLVHKANAEIDCKKRLVIYENGVKERIKSIRHLRK